MWRCSCKMVNNPLKCLTYVISHQPITVNLPFGEIIVISSKCGTRPRCIWCDRGNENTTDRGSLDMCFCERWFDRTKCAPYMKPFSLSSMHLRGTALFVLPQDINFLLHVLIVQYYNPFAAQRSHVHTYNCMLCL